MPEKLKSSRLQYGLFATPLEELIGEENEVRVIDAFVDALDLVELGFSRTQVKQLGAGSYTAASLLKLYLYGYLNQIRSSRKLARECKRNVELWWLLEQLQPEYHTIADFRKENPKAIKATFRYYSRVLKDWELLGGKIVAIDGTKLRGQNAKKNNFNQSKVDHHLDYIGERIDHFLAELDRADSEEKQQELQERIEVQQERRAKYEELQVQLEASDEQQISTTDPDARALPLHRNIIEVGYNLQSVVDAEHNLVVDYAATNQKDDYALHPMAQAANDILQSDELQVLADKGYHTGSQLQACAEDQSLITLVAPKQSANGKAGFRKSDFLYMEQDHSYLCPMGERLTTNGSWYQKNAGGQRKGYRYQRFTLPAETCQMCPYQQQCNAGGIKSRRGRYIERSEHDSAIESNAERVRIHKELYRRRQAIVEHPFGTLKRSWGYTYFLLKGLEKVDGEAGLMLLSYNLRRSMSILGVPALIERLKALKKQIFAYFVVVDPHRAAHSKLKRRRISGTIKYHRAKFELAA